MSGGGERRGGEGRGGRGGRARVDARRSHGRQRSARRAAVTGRVPKASPRTSAAVVEPDAPRHLDRRAPPPHLRWRAALQHLAAPVAPVSLCLATPFGVKTASPGPWCAGVVPPARPHASAVGANPGLRQGVNVNDSGSAASSVRVLVALFVGGMNVSHRGAEAWPLVPVHALQPGEQPWLNHKQGCPLVSGRPLGRPAGQPPSGPVQEQPEWAPTAWRT